MQETFNITLSLPKTYNFTVNVTYKSDQVIRFTLQFTNQEMKLEKRLNEKQPWKVVATTFHFTSDHAAANLKSIFTELDYIIAGPKKKSVYNSKGY